MQPVLDRRPGLVIAEGILAVEAVKPGEAAVGVIEITLSGLIIGFGDGALAVFGRGLDDGLEGDGHLILPQNACGTKDDHRRIRIRYRSLVGIIKTRLREAYVLRMISISNFYAESR